ncbi:HNH endonuclease [Bacillus phage vB_BanS_Sophrita]|uniref:Histone-lysine n-methyltransferase n=1 Tax=Bacillus phage vB_BanS_Sophrita TaxID=2894790 RepID=A0AAE8YU70_9CAUD|nr:HNH endonuclease [Bacillus phage vB_BanS_Sophrita]UGO50843.1 histone-lysine n-methyltransferase [Bacillus phage vB_BanS_Sophrita]
MIKYCIICDSEIPRGQMSYSNKKYQAKKYCCAECHHVDMKKEFEYKCADCQKKVIRTKEGIKTNVFCNDTCKGRYVGKKNKNGKPTQEKKNYKITCQFCEIESVVTYSRRNRKFCNQNCRASYNAKKNNQTNRVEVLCNNCDKKFEKVPSDIKNLNFCKTDCMYEYYSKEGLFSGENSGTWNGGKITYYGKNWLSQRRKVRKRDNYTCQKCGIHENEYGQELSVHHKKPFVMFDDYIEANQDDNLTCVCEPCHREIHSGDNHPSKFKKSVDDIV